MRPSIPEKRDNTQSVLQQNRNTKEGMGAAGAAEKSVRFEIAESGPATWALRGIFLLAAAAVCYVLQPWGLQKASAALTGFFLRR